MEKGDKRKEEMKGHECLGNEWNKERNKEQSNKAMYWTMNKQTNEGLGNKGNTN